MEKEYKRGLAMCTAKTLDKTARRWGVLNGEIYNVDLTRKPSMDLGLVQGISETSMKLDKEMNRSVKNIL